MEYDCRRGRGLGEIGATIRVLRGSMSEGCHVLAHYAQPKNVAPYGRWVQVARRARLGCEDGTFRTSRL